MKKLLIGWLILITACQSASSTPIPESPTATIQPPPETATATTTRSATPSPTLTLTPVPKYFTEEFNSDMSAWVSFQTAGETTPTATIENDMLRVDISSRDTWYYAIHNSNEYKNVSISAKFNGAPSGSAGVICNYSESGWYEFNLASDGTYSILLGQSLADGIAKYIPITTDAASYLQAGNLSYEIGLACQENFLLLYINGTLIRNIDVSNYGLPDGKIGITASSFTEPMTAYFEWIKVSE
ncbi:MAG: hypothetical protein H7Y59_10875 [Anaerolineales bacterium]|nr:hypothetical protein [Anaerolineales bacterium]